jgi:uncharacterized protein YbbC (DUF1343 family)
MKHSILFLIIFLPLLTSCTGATSQPVSVKTGCEHTSLYLEQLRGKSVGIVANHTTIIGHTHLVDSLVSLGIHIATIFAPEHGFRGDADAGADIRNGVDPKTGIRIVSLYGNKTRPDSADLKGIDLMVYDIQDVGVRFYTYISTLHYILEACAQNDIPLLILDRPDPLGFYIDGPVREPEYTSFVGLDPLPVVYGMTPGELAGMMNGEGWLSKGLHCDLQVIPCSGYDHTTRYVLPVSPSPNLNSMEAVYLYPSVCFFEGTIMSLGRGTEMPFRVVGHPDYPDRSFSFIPRSGKSNQSPLLKDQVCYGIDLRKISVDSLQKKDKIDLQLVMDVYRNMHRGKDFFIPYIDRLAGTGRLKEQIIAGMTPDEIRQSWQPGLRTFAALRRKYLLYPDF